MRRLTAWALSAALLLPNASYAHADVLGGTDQEWKIQDGDQKLEDVSEAEQPEENVENGSEQGSENTG